MTPRQTPTNAQLKAMSEHLAYELWMLRSVAGVLGLGVFGEGQVRNALLESFSIHARTLLDFFFPAIAPPPRDDDLLASDYFQSAGRWEDVRGELPRDLIDVRRRVGKEIAHLTITRLDVTPETKPWNFPAIAAALDGVFRKFLRSVDPGLLAPDVKKDA